jgi:hypothetical protein
MDDIWYYAEGDKSVGPLSLADLTAFLSHASNARSTLVWRDGFSSWVKAESVPELARYVIKPPPLPTSPLRMPQQATVPKSPTVVREAPSTHASLETNKANPQTRSVIIAALVGLAISTIGAAIELIQKGRLEPIDPYYIFNPEILAYWIGRLGALSLLFIVVTVAATARKAGLRRSIFNGLGTIVCVSLVIAVTVLAVAAVKPKKEFPYQDAGSDRDTFVKSIIPKCITNTQAHPEYKNASAATLNEFCTCYANSLADVVTMDEVYKAYQNNEPPPSMVEKIKASYQKCQHR